MEVHARTVGWEKPDPSKRLVLKNQTFIGESFGNREWRSFSIEGCQFERCSFENMRSESGCWGAGKVMSTYIDCVFDGAKINYMSAGHSRFEKCSFENVNLKDWWGFSMELVDCTFSGKLTKVIINGTVPPEDAIDLGRTRNEIRGNDFTRAKLSDVGFRTGVDLTLQKFPTGPDYLLLPDAVTATQKARAKVIRWTDLELRQEALFELRMLDESIAEGQHQFWLNIDDYSKKARPAIRALFDELRD
jgi:hypothetical protein